MNNSWHNGVVDMSFATQPSNHHCLLSEDEMQAWSNPNLGNYDQTKWNLLQQIQCNNDSGLDCYNAGSLIFGPPPTGDSIASLVKSESGDYCIFKDAANPTKPINIGPPDKDGNCTRNIFYCNGHGTCVNGNCRCDDGYTTNNTTGMNVCIKRRP